MNISVLGTPTLTASGRQSRGWQLDDYGSVARVLHTAVVTVGVFMAAAIAGVALYGHAHADRIYEGVSVAEVSVGGLSESEARARLDARFRDYASAPIALTGDEESFTITPRRAGITVDSVATVDAAFEYGRSGPIWSRAADWALAALDNHTVDPVFRVDQTRLDAHLTEVAGEVTRHPVNASVQMTAEDGPTIQAEQSGVAFDLTTTRARLFERFSTLSNEPVVMALPSVPAEVTAAELAGGLEGAQAAVASPLVLSALDTSWIVSAEDLKRIVSVPSEDGKVSVDRRSLSALIEQIAADINRPSQDARLYVTDDGEFAVAAAVKSVKVDVDASLDASTQALLAGTHDAELVVGQQGPAITDTMAAEAKRQAETLVAEGIEVRWSDGSARLGRGDLIASITIDDAPGEDQPFAFGFDETVLGSLLEPITAEIDVEARDALFRLEDGEVTVVEEAKTGRAVDVGQAVALINDAVLDGKSGIDLPIETVNPAYTESDRAKIKVEDVLGESSTYYGNSSDPRRKNIEQAVRLETGWLIPPDGIFSYNEFIGEVTKEEGFATGFGIVADGAGGVTTAPVIGGGICQVSTTIFQAGFWAGLETVERWTHPYWINTYGEAPTGMKGLDAMVNIEEDWSLDLKMRNTTRNWIALVLRADGERVSAEFVGTDPGWTIDVHGPTISNVVTPDTEMIYTESPELPAGQELRVESAQEGFDAAIRRIITDSDGQVIDDSTISGTYSASHNTILRGTG